MNRIARLVGLAAVLLIVFLAAVLASGLRLRQHTELLRQAGLETKRHQLEHILALTHPASPPWTDAYIGELATLLDAQVRVVLPPNAPATAAVGNGMWQFAHTLCDDNGRSIAVIQVTAQPPPTFRLGEVYRRTALILLMVALGLLAVLVTAMLFNMKRPHEPDGQSGGSRAAIGTEFDSLTHLARTNTQQSADLERERGVRLRADEDLHFQQILLNRSLEAKIELGRELHDGVIQSLYATGLTFEAAKNQLARDPAEAARQLENGLKTLNATIREVRSYIGGLTPDNLRQQNFTESVHALTRTLSGGRDTTFDLRIDEVAAARLTSQQSTDLLLIIREAVSNGLRHGEARKITIRLHQSGNELGLLVQDDGVGFDSTKNAGSGRGLGNIQARAERIRAGLRVVSSPGEGTRTILTLPIPEIEPKS